MRKNCFTLIFLALCGMAWAQGNLNPEDIAHEYLLQNKQEWGIPSDQQVSLRKTDQHTSAHNGVTHIYFIQQFEGVDIYGAHYNANVFKDRILSANSSLLASFNERLESDKLNLDASAALSSALTHLGADTRTSLVFKEKENDDTWVFESGNAAFQDIPVHLEYRKLPTGKYTLSWAAQVKLKAESDLVEVVVDASSGKIIDEVSMTMHCSFEAHSLGNPHHCTDDLPEIVTATPILTAEDGAQYNVVSVPFESPWHSNRRIVSNPADPVASPHGWHDQDGVTGPEHTTTFGNNTHTYIDRDGNLSDNEGIPDGGNDLVFDFPFDQTMEPIEYQDASVVNMFYMTNIMHDLTYHYGFDEAAGNFQYTNYTGAGEGGDYVIGLAQFGADMSNPPYDNALFELAREGNIGRMRMYLWSEAGQLRVDEPASVAGLINTTSSGAQGWGAAITDVPVTAEVAIVQDESGSPSEGCFDLINGAELEGKIALIDRGSCEFGEKALNAQEAGAVGFIICNYEEGLVNMGAGVAGGQVTIPGVFISNGDCQRIRVHAGEGLTVSLVSGTNGAQKRAGSFDNGVISHEYGHGVSSRLTGGSNNVSCLRNYDHPFDENFTEGEQMGEGWSDFFTLITTVKPGDSDEKVRGIGTYALGQDTSATGIRPFPYSTDMSINPMTYDDIASVRAPHGVGAVWCTMIWDLYWALSDAHGWDEDLYTGDGGNNLAIQLVMDGMKIQPCNPGFVDARDAILLADVALTGGQNQLLIWEVFARRGLGYSAIQGDHQTRLDGAEAFDLPPELVEELKLAKRMNEIVSAGEPINVVLTLTNDKPQGLTAVTITDVIPEGCNYSPGSASHPLEQQGDILVFDIGDLAIGESIDVTYILETSPNLLSERLFFDDLEQGDFNWDIHIDEGSEFWQLQNFETYSGNNAWAMSNSSSESDVSLELLNSIEISGEKPILGFFHRFSTEKFNDGGILEVSTNDGQFWETVNEDRMVRRGYVAKIPYGTFAVPNLRGWTGDNGGWQQTVVDLSEYIGSDIKLRWRFGSNEFIGADGWYLDDIEIMDAFNYNSEACATSDEGDEVCAVAPGWGTILESGTVSSTQNLGIMDGRLKAYPNPAGERLNIEMSVNGSHEMRFEMISSTGQKVWESASQVNNIYKERITTADVPRGFYFIRAYNKYGSEVIKVILQ